MLAACTGAYFAVRVGQLALSPVLPAVVDDLHVSTATAGLALTVMWLAYAAAQLPSGLLAGRLGGRQTVLLALGGVAVGAALVAVAGSPVAFVAAVVVVGGAAGLYYNAGASLLASAFDAVGAPIGLHKLGSRAAGVVTPVAAAGLLAVAGWRAVPAAATGVAVLGVVGTVGVVGATPAPGGATPSVRAGVWSAVEALRRPEVAGTTVLTAGGEFVEQAVLSFLPTFLAAYRGVSLGTAGALFAVTFVAAAAVGPVAGWLADRYSANAAATATMTAGVAGFLVLLGGPAVALPVGAALVGLSMGWSAPLQSRVLNALEDGERGAGFGAYRTGYLAVGSLGSVVVGTTAAKAGWGVAVALLAAVLALAALGLLAERVA
ncbi:MFS transporter [Halocalculus aciditolerans]|uniref:MFS transporter n=1 Tax=Halocalculus aciditolerans TaxID=1383812 RepID=A0A830F7K9_9EURY|nr:MFS transporter [Halocalculus aciditolerans]